MASALSLPLSPPFPLPPSPRALRQGSPLESIPGRASAAFVCEVCGNDDVHHDEVADGDVLHMAQCQRCEHRWTWHDAGERDSMSLLPLRASDRDPASRWPARLREAAA